MANELQLLLVEDNPGDARLIRELLNEAETFECEITNATRLDESLKLLDEGNFEVMLLDLGLPDSQGLDTFRGISSHLSELPIVILTGLDDDNLALEAIKEGAQDYLNKTDLSGSLLVRVLKYAIERKGTEESLRESEEKFKAISSSANDAIIMIDNDGNISFWNKAAEEIFGVSAGEILGKNFHEMFVPEKYHKPHQKGFETFQKTGDGAAIGKTLELSAYRKDGTEFPIDLSLSSVMLNGKWHAIGIVRDITERKRMEDVERVLLHISEATHKANSLPLLLDSIRECLNNIMDTTNFYIALYDAEHDLYTFPLFSDKYETADGAPERLKKSLTDYVRSKKRPLLADKKLHDQLMSEGECRLIGEASEVWMGAPLIIDDIVIGVVALQSYTDAQAYTKTDLDTLVIVSSHIAGAIQRKRSEEIIQESEKKFRTLYDGSSDAVMLLDEKGFFDCNDATLKIFGCTSKAEFCSKHPSSVSPPIQPCGTDSETLASRFMEKALKKGHHRFEWLHQKSDGTRFPCEVLLNSMLLGERQALQAVVRDITERKKSEEELLKLLFAIEQSANIVVITDTKGTIEYVNPRFTEVTGYTADEAIGKNPRILKSGDTSNESYRELWETIASGKSWCGEFHNKKKNGELYWEKATISPITDESGSIISYLGIKEDVTEQKHREARRLILEMEMNQARKLEAVGSLAAGIAHEINTPIQFVGDNTSFLSDSFKSLISLVESYDSLWRKAKAGGDLERLDSEKIKAEEDTDLEYLKEEVPAAVEQTLEGVQRVTTIVRAMKDFALSDQGHKSMSNLNDMLESTLTVARNELKYVADVETNLDPELQDVECYRDELNQVFLNLLVNAAHAIADVVSGTTGGKGIITVSTSQDSDSAVVKISDTGRGIPMKIRDRIFDPFFSTKDVGKGSGQGLSIARKIVVEKHNGSLDFETEIGKGTTFIVRLPIRVPENAEVVT